MALIANMLILPFVPLAMLLTFMSGVMVFVPMIGVLIANSDDVATWLYDSSHQLDGWI